MVVAPAVTATLRVGGKHVASSAGLVVVASHAPGRGGSSIPATTAEVRSGESIVQLPDREERTGNATAIISIGSVHPLQPSL